MHWAESDVLGLKLTENYVLLWEVQHFLWELLLVGLKAYWPDVCRFSRMSRTSERSSVRRRRASSSGRDVFVAAPLPRAGTFPSPCPDTTNQYFPAWTRLPRWRSSPCPHCLTVTPPSPSSPPTPTSTPRLLWRGLKRRLPRQLLRWTRCWTCEQRALRRSPISRSRPPTCPQPWRWTEGTDGPLRTGRYDPGLRLWDTTGRRQTEACQCPPHRGYYTRLLTKVRKKQQE